MTQTKTQPRPQTNKMIIRKIDIYTIEVELKLHINVDINHTAKVDATFRHRNAVGYFNNVKDFIHIMTEKGVEIPLNEYMRYVAQPLGTEGVRINGDLIEIENEELIYLTIRYLMLRRGYYHIIAIRNLLLYNDEIRYDWAKERWMLELALLALNTTDFETVSTMFDRLYNEVRYRLREAEEKCERRIKNLEEKCGERSNK